MEVKTSTIKEELINTDVANLEGFIVKYSSDERKAVQAIVERARRQLDSYNKELLRTEKMKMYEREYSEYTYICGIDEVGRGPLAGPVVAGAVILPKDCDILYLNDSTILKYVLYPLQLLYLPHLIYLLLFNWR